MNEDRLDRMEHMLASLIESLGTVKAYFEEERENNQRKFEQIDQRFEQIDQRFEQMEKRFEQIDQRFEQMEKRFEQMDQKLDAVLNEIKELKIENHFLAAKTMKNEIAIEKLKQAYFS